jgi:phosphatidylserine decarboxylase
MRIARESWPFAAVLASAGILIGWLVHPLGSLAVLPPLGFTLWFFRDPERETPDAPGVLVSPADGKIIRAAPGCISIFMNVFDVHVCRSPVAGRVESVSRRPGRFLAAFTDAAAEQNERAEIVVAAGARRVRFSLIAGLIARRIVCKVRPGEEVCAGQRVGLIRFGSRVDLALPEQATPSVVLGQRVKAGETILCRLPAEGRAVALPRAPAQLADAAQGGGL